MTEVSGLSCTGLRAGYGRLTVCRDISFEVAPGELLAVLGPNGAGKSTLLRALAGLSQKGGQVQLGSTSLTRLGVSRRAKAGLAFVPEARGNLFRSMTVGENLRIAGRRTDGTTLNERRTTVSELFPILDTYIDKPSGLLSGGEQQMLAIAMALVADPKVILLDEPSQGLAPSVLKMIETSLIALRRTGMTILLAEQNQEFAAHLADRFVIISHGHIAGAGDAAQLEDRDALAASYFG